MNNATRFLVLSCLLVAAPAPAQAQSDFAEAEMKFEHGYYKEQAEHDLEGALEIYAAIIDGHQKQRQVVARALVRMGHCQARLQREDEARTTFQRVIREFEDQLGVVRQATHALKDLDSGQKVQFNGLKVPAPAAGEVELLKQLKTRLLTLDFADTPLTDCIAFIRDVTEMNFVIDPHTRDDEMRVNLRVKDLTLKHTLQLLTTMNGLDYQVLHGAVYISSPDRLQRYGQLRWSGIGKGQDLDDTPEGKSLGMLRTRRLTVNFNATPLVDVLEFIRDVSGLNVVLDPAVRETPAQSLVPVHLNLKDLSLEQVLRLILMPRDCEYGIHESGVVIIRKRDE